MKGRIAPAGCFFREKSPQIRYFSAGKGKNSNQQARQKTYFQSGI
jgi:hypothetical protein